MTNICHITPKHTRNLFPKSFLLKTETPHVISYVAEWAILEMKKKQYPCPIIKRKSFETNRDKSGNNPLAKIVIQKN